VLRSFAREIFSCRYSMRTQEYFVYFKDEWDACGEKDPGKTG